MEYYYTSILKKSWNAFWDYLDVFSRGPNIVTKAKYFHLLKCLRVNLDQNYCHHDLSLQIRNIFHVKEILKVQSGFYSSFLTRKRQNNERISHNGENVSACAKSINCQPVRKVFFFYISKRWCYYDNKGVWCLWGVLSNRGASDTKKKKDELKRFRPTCCMKQELFALMKKVWSYFWYVVLLFYGIFILGEVVWLLICSLGFVLIGFGSCNKTIILINFKLKYRSGFLWEKSFSMNLSTDKSYLFYVIPRNMGNVSHIYNLCAV